MAQVMKGCATQNIHTSSLRVVSHAWTHFTPRTCTPSSRVRVPRTLVHCEDPLPPEGGASAELPPPADLGGQTSLWNPLTAKFDRDSVSREDKTKKQGNTQRASLASQLFSAMPPREAVKGLVLIMMSVSWWSYTRKPLKFRHCDISRAHFH